MKGDSVTSWLKTLLSDAFFWTDNDFVVQTRSMYGGVPRERAASFLFDQTGQVSHFRYFTNPATADAITSALIESAAPSGFRAIGPLSWAGKDSGGLRGAAPANDPAKPALIVLPGILGSNLKIGDERVWLELAHRQRARPARIQGGRQRHAAHRARRPDRHVLRQADRVLRRDAQRHAVRLRLARADRAGSRPSRRRHHRRARRAHANAAAGAHRRAFDGRARRARDAARRAGGVEAPDGASKARASSCSARPTAARGRRCRC